MKLGVVHCIQEQRTRSETKGFHKILVDQFYFFISAPISVTIRDFNKTFIKMQSLCELYTNELHKKVIRISGGEKIYYLNFSFGSDLLTPECRDKICH